MIHPNLALLPSVDGDRAEYDRLPPEPVRDAWCEWLTFHTVDPCRVIVPGWVERDEARRQIRYRALKLDDEGNPVIVVEVVQLEARPPPFPVP